jgi:hypothetical protein
MGTPQVPSPYGTSRTNHKGVDSAVESRAWHQLIIHDASPFALMPSQPELLQSMLEEVNEYMGDSFAESTSRTDKYHLDAWAKVCEELGTPRWRTDMAANMGLDPNGYRREQLLAAIAYLRMYQRMSPRSHKHAFPNPRSCMQKLYAVARAHKKIGFQMAPFTLAVRVMAGMLQRYVENNGTDALQPARKNPFTNEMILQMLRTPVGSRKSNSSVAIEWSSPFGVGLRATIETLAETGMRKSDVSKYLKQTPFKKGRLTFASLKWRIGGERVAAPTRVQLESVGNHPRDGCWLWYMAQ